MHWFTTLKQQARHLKSETFALYLAARDPRTPWFAKLLVAAIVAYALSPIDLIPDFLPIIGYLDDLVLITIGITLAIKLIPGSVLEECRVRALETIGKEKPVSWFAGFIIILIWSILTTLCILWFYDIYMEELKI